MKLWGLPDDVLSYIIDYLDPLDRMSLIKASTSIRIKQLIQQKRIVNLSSYHSWDLHNLNEYLKLCVSSGRVRVLNLSHCYWVPQYLLIEATSSMQELEELYIHDTKLDVIHLSQIFKNCLKISKLSMSVANASWKRFKIPHNSHLRALQKGFRQLTYLKIVWFQEDRTWLLTLRLLIWCIKCLELHLEPFFTSHAVVGRRTIDYARTTLFERLKWMENLKSLIYVQRGVRARNDHMMVALCEWIFTEIKFKQLEHFWMQSESEIAPAVTVPSTIKSFNISKPLPPELERSRLLFRIGGIRLPFSYSLPQLTYFSGTVDNIRDLYEFCKQHPLLEHLVLTFEVSHGTCRTLEEIPNDWIMPKLRIFYFHSSVLNEDFIRKIPHIMPNLEELRIEQDVMLNGLSFDLTSIPLLHGLKKLSVSGRYTGHPSILYQIMEECKKLQSLRIAGTHVSDHNGFFASLCVALPLATNLSDFTLFWRCRSAAELHTILTAVEKCPNLRRVMINPDLRESDPLFDLPGLSDKILRVINTLDRLNMFYLFMDVDPLTLDVTMEKIATQIVPQRPSLLCYIGSRLSPCLASAPAIHRDQMLFPMNVTVPTKFL